MNDVEYPRNSRIRSFLEEHFDARIDIVPRPRGSRLSRLSSMFIRALNVHHGDYDLVVLSEFSIQYARPARLAARRAKAAYVVDFFVGLDETETGDFGQQDSRSLRSIALRYADRAAVRGADFCLTDTMIRAARFSGQFDREFLALPVGAPNWAYDVTPRPPEIDLLYYGSYLPLHQVDTFIEALAIEGSPAKRVTFVGTGPTRPAAEQLVHTRGLGDRIEFLDDVPASRIAELLALSRACAGIMGDSLKAREVIANKVWQSLSAGVPVITRESAALDEIRGAAGSLLWTVQNPTARSVDAAIRGALSNITISSKRPAANLESYVQSRYALFGDRLQLALRVTSQ